MFAIVSCHGNKCDLSDLDIIKSIKSNDEKLGSPKEGDWLLSHQESGQSFDEYKDAKSVHPDSIHHTIYLLPIGNFSDEQNKVIKLTARLFINIF